MGIAWVVVSGLVAAGADYLLKRWSLEDAAWLLVAGVAGWALSALFFAFSLKGGHLLVNGALFVMVSGVLVFAVSRWVFREPLSSTQWVGLGLAVAAVVLLEV